MTITQQFIVMAFGALIALTGLALLFRGRGERPKGDQKEQGKDVAKNHIEVLGLKLEMSTPALTVFLVGSAIFVMPFFLSQQPSDREKISLPATRTLFTNQGTSLSFHNVELSSLVAKSKRNPPKVNDLVTIEFTVKNVGDRELRFEETFVAARSPDGVNKDFGHGHQRRVLQQGESVKVRAETVVNALGNWTLWPCYTLVLSQASEEEKYCPSRWESFVIEVEQ